MHITNLFHRSTVGKTTEQPTSIKVLKETTSNFVNELQQVKQKADNSLSMDLMDNKKINDCYKKIHRECKRIVINAEKFQNKHYIKDRNAVTLDALKLKSNLTDFISLTSSHNINSDKLSYMNVLVNDAIESSTSTQKGNGVHLNSIFKTIAEITTPIAK